MAALSGLARPALAAPTAALFAGLAALATLFGWYSGGGSVDVAWAPALDLRFSLELDGLAALYSLLATGIGFAVFVYSWRYLPLHLEHESHAGKPEHEHGVRFFAFMALFMGSMVGLAMAQDLILVFLFWDLTAIASYFLIGFDRHKEDSRASALMALVVTGSTAVLLLVGALMLYGAHGTFSIPELARLTEPGPLLTVAGGLIAIAGLAKSAQVPFQFWLPRAMAAPTPVSAYLHSAAMVAAGVLLIGRVYPLLQKSETLLTALMVVGLLSIAVGGILALTRDVLKQLLAYSTISQYGYVVFMYGLGGKYGAVGAALYVIAHALAKSALFLTAGAASEATGETRLSRLGGLAPRMPALAVGSGVAAAGLAAFPFTIGFFKDELFYGAAFERGAPFAFLALAATILTLAYTWRFWSGVFLGPYRTAAEPVSGMMTGPILGLGALTILGGVLVGPFADLARAAGAASYLGAVKSVEPAYHLDARPENLLALATFALGALLILTRPYWQGAASLFARAGEVAGPERAYNASVDGLNRLSTVMHNIEVRDMRSRVAAILLPAGVLVGIGFLATVQGGTYRFGSIDAQDWPLLFALVAASLATIATAFARKHVTIALVLSSSGFSVAVAFAFFGAPDVALVAVLVETIVTLVLLGMLRLIPRKTLESGARIPIKAVRRKAFVAVVAGCFAMAISWSTLSQPSSPRSVAQRHIALTPDAHGKDVVTVILADFRGLDTMGEISVVALVLLGVATLLARGRLP
ncbi:hydrogen gas-evolving membrane-bound hydrogenase subunit E [Rubrobacter aplysinae]|uniref:hydrogen gas-evolving membrane-bound hydrogenase subunit E n=1 Tax=Rubrobacter aplysinae TaxID=909625 RepID=UPI001F475C31|nr:hydrogen gas-evolving membrane-bound hydrogenase subunit E [Rubrobacter aplysinae]